MIPKFNANISNYQDVLKLIAIITMLIDHTGVFFLPEFPLFRVIGRIAMPIFCFFAGYNFKQTPKFSVLLGAIFLLLYSPIVLKYDSFTNILIPIFIGQCYLYCFKSKLNNFSVAYIHVIILCFLWNISWYFDNFWIASDYGTVGIAIMVMGYTASKQPKNVELCSFISLFLAFLYSIACFYFNVYYFSGYHLGLLAIIFIGIYYLFNFMPFNKKISLNLRIITRYSLITYCMNLVIFSTIQFIQLVRLTT